MLHTPICDLIGITYPVFQGGMAWIADGRLAAAVSNGGGLGIIAAGNADGNYVREQIRIAKSLTEMQGGTFDLYLDGDLFKVTITFPRVTKEEHAAESRAGQTE